MSAIQSSVVFSSGEELATLRSIESDFWKESEIFIQTAKRSAEIVEELESNPDIPPLLQRQLQEIKVSELQEVAGIVDQLRNQLYQADRANHQMTIENMQLKAKVLELNMHILHLNKDIMQKQMEFQEIMIRFARNNAKLTNKVKEVERVSEKAVKISSISLFAALCLGLSSAFPFLNSGTEVVNVLPASFTGLL